MEQKSNPQNNEFYQKGLSALRKNNAAYAVELFQGVLENYPDFTECRHYLLRAARENRETNKLSFSSFVLNSMKIFLLNIKATYFTLKNNFTPAINLRENIILQSPNNVSELYKLAALFNKTGLTANAIVILEEIIFIDKRNPATLKLLARLYFQDKNYPKAKTVAKILLNVSARNLEAENILKDIAALGTIEKGFDELKPAT